MKTIVKNEEFYDSARKREFEKPYMIEKFRRLMQQRDFSQIKELLDQGFDPNIIVPIEEKDYYSYDNGMITGCHIQTNYYQLLDLCEDSPALQKLLRSYGAKTSEEIRAEREEERKREEERERQEREAEKKARNEKEMEEVNKLLG